MRRTARTGAGKRLRDAGGAAAIEGGDYAIEQELRQKELEAQRSEQRRLAAVRQSAQAAAQVQAAAQGGFAAGWGAWAGGAEERPLGEGDCVALEECYASIPRPTAAQCVAMAGELGLSARAVSGWYAVRQRQ
jgi:hypothetical protein